MPSSPLPAPDAPGARHAPDAPGAPDAAGVDAPAPRPFDAVLIANRGEIAVRLIRACRALGLRAVAAFSDADAGARHVALADEAVRLGPAEARGSYLDGERVVAAALACGAGAVHPGYGFLAENPAFARRVEAAGLVWVGPSPSIIAAMGAKIEAKRLAERAGVPCVPGYHGEDRTDATLLREAERIGVPLLIKASAGGGGRGMRLVRDLADLPAELDLARREAEAAFGDPAVLLERYVEAPRHVEVQVLGDRHGNVRHLFERDCSVQRNYQKIVEEAPAPDLAPRTRERILGHAVRLAEAIGYDSAGTVEFVLDAASGEAYFLEMNTRLQVEHPVTELVTGVDLAAWQLRVAAGERLDFAQDEVRCEGWAIEARVAAESPADGYRPRTGTLTAYVEPEGPGLRVDSGVGVGSEVTPHYDSMLAKVIARGDDRDAARRDLRRALGAFRIGGVEVNLAFLRDVLDLPAFRAGEHLTTTLPAAYPGGWTAPAVTDLDAARAALRIHLERAGQGAGRGAPASAWSSLGAWRLGEPSGRDGAAPYHLRAADDRTWCLRVVGRGGDYRVVREEHGGDGAGVLAVSGACLAGGDLVCREGDRRLRIEASVERTPAGDRVTLHRDGAAARLEVLAPEQVLLDDPAAAGEHGDAILAPTPGLVAEVLVEPGQAVAAGEPVVVLESMKLLQRLCAPRDGVVEAVHRGAGDTVDGGEPLVGLRPAEPGQAAGDPPEAPPGDGATP